MKHAVAAAMLALVMMPASLTALAEDEAATPAPAANSAGTQEVVKTPDAAAAPEAAKAPEPVKVQDAVKIPNAITREVVSVPDVVKAPVVIKTEDVVKTDSRNSDAGRSRAVKSAGKRYDTQEVVRTQQDVDRSRVINTTSEVPGYTRVTVKPAPAQDSADAPLPRKRYDTQEVVRTQQDVDRSRVINTTTEVPGYTRVTVRPAPEQDTIAAPQPMQYDTQDEVRTEQDTARPRVSETAAEQPAYSRTMPKAAPTARRAGTDCPDCVPSRDHYDTEEVVRTHQDVDRSRVINTTTEVPGYTRITVKEAPAAGGAAPTDCADCARPRYTSTRERRTVRVPVVTVVHMVVQRYHVVDTPNYVEREVYSTPSLYRPSKGCSYSRRGSCRILRVRG